MSRITKIGQNDLIVFNADQRRLAAQHNTKAPRNYVATVVYRNTLDDDGSDSITADFILPHEETKYRELLDNIKTHGRYLVRANLTRVR